MLRCFAFVLFITAARAQYTVRLVTVSVPELPAVRAAMHFAPEQDGDLRKELLPAFAAPVSDILMRCGPGRSSFRSAVETPYATEFGQNEEHRQVRINAFTVKNVGQFANVNIEPRGDGEPLTLAVSWERVRDAGRTEFPTISMKTFSNIEQPRFITDHISTRLVVTPGQWQLLGMVRPVETEPVAAPRALLTFVQVHVAAPAKSVAAPRRERLHWLTLRVPAAEGMKLSTRPAGGDAELLEGLLQRAESGGIALTGHAACAMPLPARSVTTNDPFATDEYAAEAASLLEIPYATEFRPDPRSFSARNAGHQFTLHGSALVWEATDDPPRMVPLSPQPEAAAMTMPEFAVESLNLHATLPPGAVRLVGVILQPDDGGPRMMHVHFLKSAGPAAADSRAHREIHAAAFSLTAADASHLASLDAERQQVELDALAASGAAQLLAWQGVAGEPGAAAAKRTTETPTSAGGIVKRAGHFLVPSEVHVHTLGNLLELNFTAASPVTGEFSVTLDRPLPPSLAAFETAAQDAKPLPAYEQAKLAYPAAGGSFASLAPGESRVEFSGQSGGERGHLLLLRRRE